jgi:hypothetical protein
MTTTRPEKPAPSQTPEGSPQTPNSPQKPLFHGHCQRHLNLPSIAVKLQIYSLKMGIAEFFKFSAGPHPTAR